MQVPNHSFEKVNVTITDIATIRERDSSRILTVQRGHIPDLVEQLIEKSRQADITLRCPKDSSKRFASPEAFTTWRSKDGGRVPYFLTDESGELAGLVWYGPAEIPHLTNPNTDPNHTFAIRLYEGYAGKGLARPFILETVRDYISVLEQSGQLDDFKGIHLETDTDNLASIPLYHKIGYIDVHVDEEKGRITMVLLPEKVHEICSQ